MTSICMTLPRLAARRKSSSSTGRTPLIFDLSEFSLSYFYLSNPEWAPIASKQVDDSMNRFLMKNRIRVQKREPEIILSGR
jgi:hypothetical protein